MIKLSCRRAVHICAFTLLTISIAGLVKFGSIAPKAESAVPISASINDNDETYSNIVPAGGDSAADKFSTAFPSFDDFEYIETDTQDLQTLPSLYLGDFADQSAAKQHWINLRQDINELYDFDIYLGILKSKASEESKPLIAVPNHTELPISLLSFVSESACLKIRNHFESCAIETIKWPKKDSENRQHYAEAQYNIAPDGTPPTYISKDSMQRLLALKDPAQRDSLITDLDIETRYETNQAPSKTITPPATKDLAWASFEQQKKSTLNVAVSAAYDSVNNRYLQTLRDIGGGINANDPDAIKTAALGLTEDAISSAASKAFDKFIEERFGEGPFHKSDMNTLRGIFIGRFSASVKQSLKSAGKQLTKDIISNGGFKAGKFDSAIISKIENDLAQGLINAAQAAVKKSKYAALRNLEIEYEIGSDSKPKYSALTVQPLYQSADQRKSFFLQASYAHEGERDTYNAGLAYRFMPLNYKYMFGVNSFIDYQNPYDHWRASIGADVKTSLYGAAVNFYKTLSDWRDRGDGYEEHSLDGYDLEVSGRLPNLPALEFFAKAYSWKQISDNDDIFGKELSAEYTPVPAMTIRAFANDEDDRKPEYGMSLRYNHKFGAPKDYALDKSEQFRLKDISERRFEKVRRENDIRVEKRVKVEDDNTNTANSISTAQFNAASTGLPYDVGGAPIGANTNIPFNTAITVPNGEFGVITFNNGAIANVSASGAGDVVLEFSSTVLTVAATNGGFVQFVSAGGGISTVNVPGGTVNLLGTDIDITDDGTTTTIQVRAGSIEVNADVGGGQQTYNQSEVATLNIGTGALGNLAGGALTTHQHNVFTNLDTQNPVTPLREEAAPFISAVPELISGPQFAGNNADIRINLSKAVNVTGAPQINALIDTTARNFIYQPAESTFTRLIFRHVYLAGDVGATTLTINGLDLNGGTIQSSDIGLNAITAYTQVVTAINDGTAPTLQSSVPADDSGFFDRTANLVLTFSEDIQIGAGNVTLTDLTDGSDTRSIAITDPQISIVNNVLTLNPTTSLEVNTDYEITIGATLLDDLANNDFSGIISGALNFNTNDATPPTLSSFTRNTPSGAATNADTLVFRASFNEDVQNVDSADFVVNGSTASVQSVASIDAATYDITISGGDLASLEGSVGLDLSGGQDIADLASNALPAGEPASDETYTIDNTAPTINLAGSAPLNGAIQIARNASPDITLNFAEANGALTLGTGNITITDTDDGSDIRVIPATDAQVSINGLNVEIDLSSALEYAENYEITFDGNFVQDPAGNNVTALTGGNLAYKTVNLEQAMVVDHAITLPADNVDENNVQGSGATFPVNGSFVLAYDLNIPASPTGLLFECGGAGQGQYVGVNGAVLRARGGEGGQAPPDTDMASLDVPLTSIPSGVHTLLVEFDYAVPEITMWIDETNLGSAGPSGGALESNRWSGGDNCAIATTTTTSIPTGENPTAFNGTVLNPVRLYSGQTVP